MAHYVLVLFRGPSKALLAVVAPMWVVLSVDGDYVAFETRGVRRVILTVLALVDFAAAVSLHVFLEFVLLPEATLAAFALKRQLFRVHGQDMPTQSERVRDLKVAVPTLVHLVAPVRFRVLFELGRPVEAFFAHVALVRKVLGVHGDDVALQVARIGALVLTVWALVSLVALENLHVPLQVLVVGKCLRAVSALERQLGAVLGLYVSL